MLGLTTTFAPLNTKRLIPPMAFTARRVRSAGSPIFATARYGRAAAGLADSLATSVSVAALPGVEDWLPNGVLVGMFTAVGGLAGDVHAPMMPVAVTAPLITRNFRRDRRFIAFSSRDVGIGWKTGFERKIDTR